ncbi:hypothetical protein F2P56_018221, partial [Juglans regia]
MVVASGVPSRLWLPCIFHNSGTAILAKLGRIDWRDSATHHLGISMLHVDTDQETTKIQWDLVHQLGVGSLGNDSQRLGCHWSNLGYSDHRNRDPLFQAPM